MKRLTAICFLCLLLFNIAGYRLWFYYAEHRSTVQLVNLVEKDQYEASDLITLTVPLSLPYQTDWAGWEKVRGEIVIDGVTYHYVQRKVANGQLVLQCLPNKHQAKIESARDRFFQLANSFQAENTAEKESSNNPVKVTKPSLTDFDDHWSCWKIAVCDLPVATFFSSQLPLLARCFIPVPGQPPECIA